MIVCKYKFDKSIYSNLIPVFNDGYNGYTVSDEIDSENSNHIIRTIECDTLPTKIRFSTCLTNGMGVDGREKALLELLYLNTSNLITEEQMFHCCSNLTYVNTENMINLHKTNHMFCDCHNLTSLDVSNFNTSNVTNMYTMFYKCVSLTSLDVSNWDTSNVTDMYYMFASCTNLTSLDVSNWDTSNVTRMDFMFASCTNLTSLDVSKWNTSKVTTMYNMFANCNKLTSLDVSNFNTSKVTSMEYMFSACKSLTSLDVSNFDTSKVTNIAYMFSGCSTLQTVGDLTNWNTKNLELCHALFYRCFKLKHAHMGGWNTSKVINVRSMFAGCESIETIDMHNFDFKNTYDNVGELFKNDMFQLKYLRINDLLGNDYAIDMIPSRTGKEQGVLISDVEISEETLTKLKAKNWTVVTSDTLTKVAEYVYDSKIWNSMIPTFNDEFVDYFIDDVEDENGLVTRTISSLGGLPTKIRFGTPFSDSNYVEGNELALLEVLHLNVNTIIDATNMFKRCIYLTSVQSSDWNTGNMISMYAMFAYCESLSILDVSNWDTSQVTNMWGVFINCYKLTSLDVSNWDTSNVTSLWATFSGCNNLTSLDVSNWDTSKVTNMGRIFRYCSLLTPLDLSNWDTSNVENMVEMFYDCRVLTSLDVSNFDTSKVTDMNNIFKNTPKLSDIGMLYCTPSTINTIASNLPTTHTQTIWVKDTDINKLTSVNGVEFKEYKENSYMINLSSPLLDGDRIEVVDGKLCHYHKMGMVVLDGSENFTYLVGGTKSDTTAYFIRVAPVKKDMGISPKTNAVISYCDTLKRTWIVGNQGNFSLGYYPVGKSESTSYSHIRIRLTLNDTSESVKQWLSENPTTIVYELANPYYEDITPLQSDIVLETYLESNLDIYTDLPIKANVSYITNVPSLSTLSMRATEMKESDNIIANLTNMLDNEINE